MVPELKRKLDYSDLSAGPDDARRYELVHGDVHVTPSPTPLHQRISKRLLLLMVRYFEGRSIGEVFDAPIDLILTNRDVFVPDLVVVGDATHVTDRGIEGPPLLIVEILSPSTCKHDRGLKAKRYSELGVENYWIVDPAARRVEYYRLAGRDFSLVCNGEGSDVMTHPDWDGLRIDLAELWR